MKLPLQLEGKANKQEIADNCQLVMNIREKMKCTEELVRVPGGVLLQTAH